MEKRIQLVPMYEYARLRVPRIWGIHSFADLKLREFHKVIDIVNWCPKFPKNNRKKRYIPPCRVNVFLITAEKDKKEIKEENQDGSKEIEILGEEFLADDNKYYFRNLSQVLYFINNNLKFFRELIWTNSYFPVMPFIDEENGSSVAYITRAGRYRALKFETFENFQKRSFRFYSFGPNGKPQCSISSDLFCIIVPKN